MILKLVNKDGRLRYRMFKNSVQGKTERLRTVKKPGVNRRSPSYSLTALINIDYLTGEGSARRGC
jgi:hypothetical protein